MYKDYTDENTTLLWTSNNNKWTIESYEKNGSLHYLVSDGWFCDYPILYPSGNIGYDNPHRIPQYVRDKVRSILTRG